MMPGTRGQTCIYYYHDDVVKSVLEQAADRYECLCLVLDAFLKPRAKMNLR